MDLFETLGLGHRQPEENELYVAIYADPVAADAEAIPAAEPWEGPRGDAGGDGVASASDQLEGGRSLAEEDRLEALRARCTAWILPYTTDYVWNKDPLVLRASSRQPPPWERRNRRGGAAATAARHHAAGTGGEGPSAGGRVGGAGAGVEDCVWAVMRFGDAVDDEWWAVWLLLRMTRELQDLSVQVWDNDGQFLLIEAAYALPRWLKPETADNRVWLRCGRLHVIPLPSPAAPDLPPSPSVAQALDVLREGRFATASQRVQRPIDERLAGYPARARREQQHTARCLLPVPLAAALRSEPQLVAELVEAFYNRDADGMRAAARMRALPPSLERVPALVRMTRCHYGQLAQQRFSAPRGLPMPPPDSPLARAADLGLKLTVGAEIICARVHTQPAGGGSSEQQQSQQLPLSAPRPKGAGPAAAGEAASASQAEPRAQQGGAQGGAGLSEGRFSADPAWQRFKGSLEANGYFQFNIPGSRRYKELMAAALEAFAAGLAADGDGTPGGGDVTVAARDARRRLAELVRGAAAAGLRAADVADVPGLAEDDDSWLDQQPDRLQAELDRRQAELNEHVNGRGGDGPTGDAGDNAKPQRTVREVDADDIASKLRSFMEQLSGLEGVETATAPASASASGDAPGGPGNVVDFNPARFLRELEQVLGAGGPLGRPSKKQRREPGRDGAAGEDEEEEDDDEGETSSEEGSSFFFSDEDGLSESDDEEAEEEVGADKAEANQAGAAGLGLGFGAVRKGKNQPAAAAAAVETRRAQPGTRSSAPDAPGSMPGAAQPGAAAAAARSTSSRSAAGVTAPQPQTILKRGFLSATKSSGKAVKPVGAGLGQPDTGAGVAAVVVAGAAGGTLAAPRPGASRAASAVPAVSSDGVAGGSAATGGGSGGSSASRRHIDWEVRTATDSDDDGESDSERGGRGREEEREHDDEEEVDATAGLLAALGVESGGSGGGGSSDEDASDGPAAAGRLVRPGISRGWQRGQLGSMGIAESSGSGGGCGRRRGKAVDGSGGSAAKDDGFMPLYDSAMQDQLAGTTLAQSFDFGLSGVAGAGGRAVAGDAGGGARGGGIEAAARGAGAGGSSGAPAGEGAAAQVLQPVDLDMNLVRNLLRSYTAQQGSAGPAGNMASMLGMSLVAGDVDSEE